MTEITFYRQKRRDGSVRSGLELDGETQLGLIQGVTNESEDDDFSMVLDWFLDLTIQVPDVIEHSDPQKARLELLKLQTAIQDGLDRLVQAMGAGLDHEIPFRWSDFNLLPEGYHATFLCRAANRTMGRELSQEVQQFALRWKNDLAELKQLTVAL